MASIEADLGSIHHSAAPPETLDRREITQGRTHQVIEGLKKAGTFFLEGYAKTVPEGLAQPMIDQTSSNTNFVAPPDQIHHRHKGIHPGRWLELQSAREALARQNELFEAASALVDSSSEAPVDPKARKQIIYGLVFGHPSPEENA